jgi:predicted permease
MSVFHAIWYRLRALVRPGSVEAERQAEFRFHLSLDEMQRRAAGHAPDEARFEAKRRFGNVTAVGEEVRHQGVAGRVASVVRSVRYAGRALIRSPGFTIATILTLTLGLGGVAAIGTVLYSILLKPLPYPDSGRLAAIWVRYESRGLTGQEQSDAAFFTFQRLARSIDGIGASLIGDVNLGASDTPERVGSARVSAGYLSILGISPLYGRLFASAEDLPGGPAVALLGEALWRRKFGADPAIVGRRLEIDGQSFEVIGILPRSVALPAENVGLWTPLAADPDRVLPGNNTYRIVVRLKRDASIESARRDLQQALDRMPEFYPDAGFGFSTRRYLEIAKMRLLVIPLRDVVVGDVGSVLWVLLGTAAFVLLVAAANVATLFLVRAESRRREAAVRMALGAARGGLIGHFAAEGLVLAGIGAILALGLAAAAIRVLGRYGAGRLPRLAEIGLDPVPLVAVVVAALVVGLACSAVPIARLRSLAVAPALRSGGRGTAGSERRWARQALVIAQIALAFALLAGSGLLARTYRELRAVRPGFDPAGVLAFRLALPAASYPGTERVTQLYQDLIERLQRLPDRPTVGAVSQLPLGPGSASTSTLWVEDQPDFDLTRSLSTIQFVVGDYVSALGIPVLAGHLLSRLDPARPSDEVLVSATAAKRFWADSSGRSAVGRRIRLSPKAPWLTVVGVVGDVRLQSLSETPWPAIYLPPNTSWVARHDGSAEGRLAEMLLPRVMAFVVRGGPETMPLAGSAAAAVGAVDPSLPLFDVTSMPAVLRASTARTTFTGWMLAAGAAIALLLGVIGVYGVVSYTASMRTREIGLRLALGAEPKSIRSMMVRQSMAMVSLGLGGGLVLTLLLTGSLQALLFGVSRNDPLTLGLVALTLAGAAAFASWIPAARAGRVAPSVTLAGE